MKAPDPVRVMLAERNPLVVSALKHLIGKDDRFVFAGSVESGEKFLELARRPQFDIAVVGWTLTDMDGSQILRSLRAAGSPIRVTIFSAEEDESLIRKAIRLGAHGFCYQFDDPQVLFDTLNASASGRICIPYIDLTTINETPLSRLSVRAR